MPRLPDFTPPTDQTHENAPQATKAALLNSQVLRHAANEYGTLLPATDERLATFSKDEEQAVVEQEKKLVQAGVVQAVTLMDTLYDLHKEHPPFTHTPFSTILHRSRGIVYKFSLLPKSADESQNDAPAPKTFNELSGLMGIILNPEVWIQPNDEQKRFEYTSHALETFAKVYGPEYGCPAHNVRLETSKSRQTSLFTAVWERIFKEWLQKNGLDDVPPKSDTPV
ncbi:MAG TPA: hypothetical protein VLG16_01750 [Candidatus Saccharimonadales bacterium]|nr:hypothetical protein [Candidatus Saccharimonadales bacterium]